MKRLLAFLLSLSLALPLAACAGESAAPIPEPSPAPDTASAAPAAEGGKVLPIALAAYPESLPYPDEADYVKPDGTIDESFWDVESAWWSEYSARRQEDVGERAPLEQFSARTMAQFLAGGEGGNRVFSPLNVYLALAMLAELTDGASRAQILGLLGVSDTDALRAQANALWRSNYVADGATTSVLANSLWLNEDVGFEQDTLDALAKYYYASSYRGKMGSEETDQALRNWLNEQTGGLLEQQASELKLDPETVLALASTIYFRARWSLEFDADATRPGVFHGAGGDESVDFMHQSNDATFFWGDRFSAVCKSLNNAGTMWFILPDEGVAPEALLQSGEAAEFLFTDKYPAYEGAPSWEDQKYLVVNLSVPKFDVSSDAGLIDGLKALGVTDVFDPNASDFTPMTKEVEKVCVSQAQHAARVAVDEEGVTAAAYTVMMACGAGGPPDEEVDFVLDRPFLFAITDAHDLPLFAGVVNQAAGPN